MADWPTINASVAHALDEDLMDRFVGTLVIPEIGDN